jgi:tRNA(Ile)-lysidine synthase
MVRKVYDYIKQNTMIEKGDGIVAGVSGGADSVCLLYVLYDISREKGIPLTVVHVNHGIRGEDAMQDAQFVETLCKKLNIEYYGFCYDVRKIADEEGLTEEEAGRKVRYASFIKVCRQKQCNKIAIAHNKNDNSETVLFHLFRGTGIRGLTGIDPVRMVEEEKMQVRIIRPLLCVTRQEIESYLSQRKIPYRTDATNRSDAYSRNKIRNHILAYAVGNINSCTVQHITGAAMQLKEIDTYIGNQVAWHYKKLVEEKADAFSVGVADLQKEDIVIQRGVIRNILEHLMGSLKDLEAGHVEQVLSLFEKPVGKQIQLPGAVVALREYRKIEFYHQKDRKQADGLGEKEFAPIEVVVPGRIYLPGYSKILETSVFEYKKNEPIPKNACTKWFDYDRIENAVVIRNRKEGDYIQINPLGGRKKIKDYFIDLKIPRRERSDRLLVADGSHIMWILGDGERISEKYKVNEKTKKILLMSLIDTEEL